MRITMNVTSILVPVDRSLCSEAAVDRAVQLAEIFGAKLTLLHAWEPLYELGAVMGAATIATVDGEVPLVKHIANEARKTLDEHKSRLSARAVKVMAKLVEGAPKEAIRDALVSGDFDLVVMGTHGRTGLSHVMMGSIAEWVVRQAQVPVMTIRRDANRESSAVQP